MTNDSTPALAGQERLIFLHVYKTAGVSVSLLLNSRFPPEQIFHVRSPGRGPAFGGIQGPLSLLHAMPREWQARIRCVLGHFSYSDDADGPLPGPSRYITVLREPIERRLSQHGQQNRRRQLDGLSPLSLREFVRTALPGHDNQQTRMLCSGSFDSQPPQVSLESAKENLRKFLVVGTTERIGDFVSILAREAGFECPETPRDNVNPNRLHREDVAPDLIDRLRAENELDRDLHRFAADLLARAVERHELDARARTRLSTLGKGARRGLRHLLGPRRGEGW